jgi:hypothetical protein
MIAVAARAQGSTAVRASPPHHGKTVPYSNTKII